MSALQLSHRGKAAKLVDERGLPSHLKCSACSQPVFNSYQTSHGCRLCQSCVEALPIQEKVACPGRTEACRDKDEDTSINQTLCYPDIASRREISKLIVTCPNKEEGCGAQFPWRDVDTHLSSCDFEKVSCDMCGEKRVKKDMVEHKSSECRQRRVTCDCGAQVVALFMKEEHKNLMSATCCPNYSIPCPHCHETSPLTRAQYLIHLDGCPEKPTKCKFFLLGCPFYNGKAKLDAHYKDSVDQHLEMIDCNLKARATSEKRAAGGTGASAAPATTAAPDGVIREAQELERKALNIFSKFKAIQPNVALWATVTMELEDLIKAFGGINGFRTQLKAMDDKLRQLEAAERASGSSGPPTASEASRLLDRIKEIELRFDVLEQTSFDGCLTWKVAGFAGRRREARSGTITSSFSTPFFSKRYGYMFRIRLFLNGTDGSEGNYISVQLVLTQSEYDDILEWPLVANVTFRLLHPRNRSEDIVSKATLDAQRPTGVNDITINVCVPKFARIPLVEEKFVKNDTIYVDVEVEPRPSNPSRPVGRR